MRKALREVQSALLMSNMGARMCACPCKAERFLSRGGGVHSVAPLTSDCFDLVHTKWLQQGVPNGIQGVQEEHDLAWVQLVD